MALFNHRGRSVLAVNNEYVNSGIVFERRAACMPRNADDVRKSKAAHGVSVMELQPQAAASGPSSRTRPTTARSRPDTPMEITGPARGHESAEDGGRSRRRTRTLGTWNNCGNGRTPWSTYLTCEENFDDYFSSSRRRREGHPRVQALRRRRRKGQVWMGHDGRTLRHRQASPTNPTAPATSSRSIRWIPSRPRRSAPPSAASSTRTPNWC